jgi:plastocyanin
MQFPSKRNNPFLFIVMTALTALLIPAVAGAAEYQVRMKFNEETGAVYYEPRVLKIKSGDTVTWVQEDTVNEHNVVTYPDGIPNGAKLFESPMMHKKGENWSREFTNSGTYRYHCHPHEAIGMQAMVIVDRESRADEFRKARAGEHSHGEGMSHGDSHGGAKMSGHHKDGDTKTAHGKPSHGH